MYLLIIIIIIFITITLLIEYYANTNKKYKNKEIELQQLLEFQQENEENGKVKVFIESTGLKTPGICAQTERTIDQYLNRGYKVVSSQLIFDTYYKYTYTVMTKE